MNSGKERLYTEEEISAILRRTAEMSKGTSPTPTTGLSIRELRGLAGEAGLNADLVELAARELELGEEEPNKTDLFGGPMTYTTKVELDSEISDEAWEQMLTKIRAQFNDPGRVQSRQGVREVRRSGREWYYLDGSPQVSIINEPTWVSEDIRLATRVTWLQSIFTGAFHPDVVIFIPKLKTHRVSGSIKIKFDKGFFKDACGLPFDNEHWVEGGL